MALSSLSYRPLPNPSISPTRVGRANPLHPSRPTRAILPLKPPRRTRLYSVQEQPNNGRNPAEKEQEPEPEPENPVESSTAGLERANPDLSSIKEAIKEKEGDLSLNGVAEEIREIEWPVFGRVLGTTGVVLAVIAGSSVVLLTVNAVLAELSDRVFAGKGVQDFFG
ncbi:preprotein translocase subunit SECE1 [Magnolia sinica]|uniref:preprotein translocase subunit SECE1 n=1 Tax=Magnolia sinica TaxID=86752 RepID=UPI00265B449D|nr:preprotein translocase subunit SECE1 [Magnolia sinica]